MLKVLRCFFLSMGMLFGLAFALPLAFSNNDIDQDDYEELEEPDLVTTYDDIDQDDYEESEESENLEEPIDTQHLVESMFKVTPPSEQMSEQKNMSLGEATFREPASRSRGRKKNLRKFGVRKKKLVVPKAKQTIKKIRRQVIKIAEPPRQFRQYFETGTDEAELESVINEEIKQLFNLLKTNNRRDLRLRLGSLYIEKARLIEYRLYEKYDQQMTLFETKKRSTRPKKVSLQPIYRYINKAIKLFETYRRQFPKDKNMDQVLFSLGVSYFKKGQLAKGRNRYEELTKRFPRSVYIHDVNFELGEYYFNQSNWKKAEVFYRKIALNRKQRLYSFALYKLAWCRFKTGRTSRAIANLEAVIREGFRQKSRRNLGVKGAGRLHFANEALGDMALFYSYSQKKSSLAYSYFQKLAPPDKALKMLKDLAYAYLDQGKLRGVRNAFKQLIEEEPYAPNAYDYQYQIIRAHTYAGSRKIFLRELKHWLVNYGLPSSWAEKNQDRAELIKKAYNLMEVTVRNYALRMHQSYRKTKDKMAKTQALFSYELYNRHFKKSPQAHEMRFFYAEMLFDLRKYRSAAQQYLYVVEKYPQSKYYETASLNSVLTFEKTLTTSQAISRLVGKKTQFVPFTRPVQDFQKMAGSYISRFPTKSNVPAILYKMAGLDYEFNHHKSALSRFWHLIKKYPNSPYTEYSANLILDIYNLKKDFRGLRNSAVELLKNKKVAQSASGKEIRKILSQVSLKSAEDMARKKRYIESAELYKTFADTHPKSPLRKTAYYNAGLNFEKAGDILKTIQLYKIALKTPLGAGSKGKNIRQMVLKKLPGLYQKIGQYMRSASAFSTYAKAFPGDKASVDFWFNSALIYDGFNRYSQASEAYLEYFKRSKKAEKTQALFLLAEMKKRQGHSTDAISYYNQFLNRGSSDRKALVESAFKIAEIKKAKRQITEAKRWYRRVINLYQKYKAGMFYAAQAKFQLIYDEAYAQYIKMRIPADPKKQQSAVQAKLRLFNKLKEDLKEVIRFDSAYQVVSALVLMGLASEHIGDAIYNSPIPKALNKEEKKQYKAGLKKTAQPFKREGIKHYKLALSRARDLSAYNEEWLKKAVHQLAKAQALGRLAIAQEVNLRKEILPTLLYDWSGM